MSNAVIVCRIDDLGRVVIPKEIRRTMRIREGDPLEIYTDRDGEVIFKKYSPIGELNTFAAQYADTLHKTCELDVLICDRDAVIAAAGVPRRDYAEKQLSEELEKIIEGRSLYVWREGDEKYPPVQNGGAYYISCAMPIISEGDILGCVVSLSGGDAGRKPGLAVGDVEKKLVETAAGFLGRQLEA